MAHAHECRPYQSIFACKVGRGEARLDYRVQPGERIIPSRSYSSLCCFSKSSCNILNGSKKKIIFSFEVMSDQAS